MYNIKLTLFKSIDDWTPDGAQCNENYPDYGNNEYNYDLIVQEVELDKKIGS